MKNKFLKIITLFIVVVLFSGCSKEYFGSSLFYADDFAVDVVDAYPISADAIKVDFVISNISSFDYFQGQDGDFYLEFAIRGSRGDEFYNETPVRTLYSGDYFRGSMIISIDPYQKYSFNSLTYDIYDAGGY